MADLVSIKIDYKRVGEVSKAEIEAAGAPSELIGLVKRLIEHLVPDAGRSIVTNPPDEATPNEPIREGAMSDAQLLLAAIIAGVARWEPFDNRPGGQIWTGGASYRVSVDGSSQPALRQSLRDALAAEMPKNA